MPRRKRQQEPATTARRLGAVIKACRDIMRKDKGLSGEVDRLPMLTWIMFLKFLDDMERIRSDEATLRTSRFLPVIEPPYRWRDWNRRNSEREDGGLHNPMTGDALIAFINQDEAVRPDGKRGPGCSRTCDRSRRRRGRPRRRHRVGVSGHDQPDAVGLHPARRAR